MIDGWSWFRERADAELGGTPPAPADRLGDVLDRAVAADAELGGTPPAPGDWLGGVLDRAVAVRRRRYAELGAAAGVVVVSLALVGATVSLGRVEQSPAEPGLPVPSEVTADFADEGSPTPAPGPVRPVDPTRTGTPDRPGVGLPNRTAVTAGRTRVPVTTRASVPVVPTTTPPPRTTPPPSATTTRPTTSPPPPPTTTTPPPTTSPTPPTAP